ncbi:MAG: acyl-CoA dehydrogenase family protein [Alphaproteobacteria bacterium]
MTGKSFENDDTQRMLLDSARAFVSRSGGVERARASREKAPGFDRGVWRTMAANGWFGLLFAEEYGGLALGFAEAAIVIEELGRCLAPEPFVSAVVLAGGVLRGSDNAALRAEKIQALIEGEVIPALAWQETANDYDPARIAARAVPSAEGITLTGSKRFIPAAAGADAFIVTAMGPDGVGLYWLEAGAAGLSLSLDPGVDGIDYGTLNMSNVFVPSDRIVLSRDAGPVVSAAVDEARLCAAAELVGVMKQAFDDTLAYVKQREQFGRPVGKFQALQHRLVDLWVQQELSRDVLAQACRCFDETGDPVRRAAEASAAKARCSEAGLLIGRQSIQLHGGIGYSDACHIGMYLKRALVLSAWLGNAGMHRNRYAEFAPEAAA